MGTLLNPEGYLGRSIETEIKTEIPHYHIYVLYIRYNGVLRVGSENRSKHSNITIKHSNREIIFNGTLNL